MVWVFWGAWYVVASRIVIPRWFVFDKVYKSKSINIFFVFGDVLSPYKDAHSGQKHCNEKSSLERNGVYVGKKNQFIFLYSAKSPSSKSAPSTDSTATFYVSSRTTWNTNYSFHLFSHFHDQWRSKRRSMMEIGKLFGFLCGRGEKISYSGCGEKSWRAWFGYHYWWPSLVGMVMIILMVRPAN